MKAKSAFLQYTRMQQDVATYKSTMSTASPFSRRQDFSLKNLRILKSQVNQLVT